MSITLNCLIGCEIVPDLSNFFMFLRQEQSESTTYLCKHIEWTVLHWNLFGMRFSVPDRPQNGGIQPPVQSKPDLSLSGLNRPVLGLNHPSLRSAEIRERVDLQLHSTFVFAWSFIGW